MIEPPTLSFSCFSGEPAGSVPCNNVRNSETNFVKKGASQIKLIHLKSITY